MSLDNLIQPNLLKRIGKTVGSSLAVLLASLACGTPAENNCQNDYDCPGDQVCIDHLCTGGTSCQTDLDCPGDQLCEDSSCIEPEEELPQITTKTVKGIKLNSGTTNQNGHIRFREVIGHDEQVDIYVIDALGQPTTATVLYFDGPDFECYQATTNYTSYFECFTHNSSHTLSLTTAPLQTLYHDNSGNDHSRIAAQNFTDWAQSEWDYLGCRNKNQIDTMIDGGSYIIKFLSDFFTLGVPSDALDDAVDYIKDEWPANTVGHIYFFNPRAHGFNATSSIWTITARPLEAEICNDYLDNDCNGNVDQNDLACNNCTPRSTKSCYDANNDNITDVVWLDSCGNLDSVIDTCLSNEMCNPFDFTCTYVPDCQNNCFDDGLKTCATASSWVQCGNFDADQCLEFGPVHDCGTQKCENGQCVNDNTCSDYCTIPGQKECQGNSWHECGNYDGDSCLEWSNYVGCGTDTCQNGQCVPQGGDGSYCDPCHNDNDCQADMKCGSWGSNPSVTWCTPDKTCTSDSQCGGGYICYNQGCFPDVELQCNNNDSWIKDSCDNWVILQEDCPATCQNGQCVTAERFVDNGNGTVTDNDTGKLWQKNISGQFSTWSGANNTCQNLNLIGRSNWRMPTAAELGNLFQYSPTGCHLDSTLGNCYEQWSATECSNGNGAMKYNFEQNGVFFNSCEDKGFTYTVRCVTN